MNSRSRKTLSLLVGLSLAAMVIALGTVSFQRKVETFQVLGFSAEAQAGGWLVTAVDTAGTGLGAGDRILLINGAQATLEQLRGSLHRRGESELLVQRGDAMRTVVYNRPAIDIDWAYLVQALIGGLFVFIGLYTLLRNRRLEGALFYAWCLLYTLLFTLTGTGVYDSLGKTFYGIEELARILLPPLTIHFFLIFPGTLGTSRRLRRAIPFLYLPAAFLAALQVDLLFANGRFLLGIDNALEMATATRQLDRLGLFHLVLFSLAVAAVLAYRVLSHEDWQERRQVQWIAFGMGFGYLPFLAFLLFEQLPIAQAFVGREWIEVAAVAPLALVPASFAWSILRYKLWDIDVILRDVVSYTATALLAIAGFSLVNLGVARTLPEDLGLARDLISFSAGLFVAAMVVPVRQQVSSSLERLQYRGRFGRRRRLPELAEQLMHERNLDHLCSSLLDNLEQALELDRANLYLLRGDDLAPARPDLLLPGRLAIDTFGDDFWGEDVTAVESAVSSAAALTSPSASVRRLYAAGYRYAFPLTVRGVRIGLALTSYKTQSQPLNSDDQELVRVLLNQAALAIENAQLVDQLHHQLDEVGRLQSYTAGIIESSPAGTVVLDGDDRIVSANGAFARLVRTTDSLTGRALSDVLPVRPLPEPGCGLVEVSYCSPDGDERHLNLSTAHFHADPAQDLRIVVVHDISEQMALETALKEKDRLASLGMLAAGVAHEVNTPITGISSYAQMLIEDTPESDPRYQLLKKVEQQTFRASRIVNSLLDFARNRVEEYRSVALDSLLQDTLDLLRESFTKRGITLDWQRPTEASTVHGSEGELQQVFTNLLLNAQDAVREGEGKIHVALSGDEKWVRVSVRDNGRGIPAERLTRIFEPFFSTKLTRGGTGLGLSISYDIVRRHGGDVAVTSHPDEGTCFTIELPRQLELPERSQQAELPQEIS